MVVRILSGLCPLAMTLGGCLAKGASLPVMLFENRGQAPADVRYILQYQEIRACFRDHSIVVRDGPTSITIKFNGGSSSSRVRSLAQLPGHLNFLQGPDATKWIRGAQLYSGVVYPGLYPGIDMVWQTHKSSLQSEFRIAPGANARTIRLLYSGMIALRIGTSGCLLIQTSRGMIREDPPVAYVQGNGGRTPVAVRFRVTGGTVRFELAPYDHSKTLLIDPVLTYSTLLSGSAHDSATSVAVDASRNAYVAGWTESFDFPATGGLARGSGIEGFVAKFTPSNTLAYCTYIGGSYEDRVTGIS